LLSTRPPSLYVLNEPETSLHSELLEPLAKLIHTAGQNAQIIVVTHAAALVGYLERRGDSDTTSQILELVKEDGETKIAGQRSLDQPLWKWPSC
jgi:predicted ATPase